MTTAAIAGLIALGVPLLIAGLVFLRGNRPVFAFYMALLAVMMGYLLMTGALDDIGSRVMGLLGTATAEKAAEPAAAVPAN
jgi:hypothetical protein